MRKAFTSSIEENIQKDFKDKCNQAGIPQNVILEAFMKAFANNEIETQDELVQSLRNLNYDVTQATVPRDIKELGLIKILSDSKKYKYAYVETNEQQISNKVVGIYKEVVISVKIAQNLVIIKTN